MQEAAEVNVAGVRLADGRQLFVDGVPEDLPADATIRILVDETEATGVVSIPPRLLVWRDPGVRCAVFIAVEDVPSVPTSLAADSPIALYLAEASAPDAATLAAMLHLAREEQGRLED